MNLKRVIRIIKRLNDPKYVRFIKMYAYDKVTIKINLRKLTYYHKGSKINFISILNKKRNRILEYAYDSSPYYKKLLDENNVYSNTSLKSWDHIPLLTKEIIKKEKDNILTASKTKSYVGYSTTGGSTGQPLGFYTFGGCDSEHQEFLYKLMGYRDGDKILAMDGSLISEELVNQNIYWTKINKNDIPYGSIALSSLYLNTENIINYIEFINEIKPSIIRGYPSFIDNIAQYIIKEKIHFDFYIKGIEITSESYFDYQIENIKKAFQTKVYIQYGHTEASVFGYSIDDTMMIYCSPFYGYTEVIGQDGNHVKKGEIGEVVVTGFNNYAMPFIRYNTGDLAEYAGEENGIVKLKKIYGRTQDYIYTSDKEKVLLTAIIFGRHYKAFDNIIKWQIIQDTPGEITFKIIKSESFSKKDEKEIFDNFHSIAKVKSKFEYVESLQLTNSGKSKFLVQNLKLQ